MVGIASSLAKIRGDLGRLSSNQTCLVAVSKLKPVSDILTAYNAEQRHFGENYVAEITEKCSQLPNDIRWHFIGHLQSNKVHKIISLCPNLYMIETVDSIKLANKINLAASLANRKEILKVLVEVKTSNEDSKSGIDSSSLPLLVDHILANCPHIEFSGLMTIADPLDPESSFKLLSTLKDDLLSQNIPVNTLSMGMSGDYELAIKYGSTEVRIGSSIFGSRYSTNHLTIYSTNPLNIKFMQVNGTTWLGINEYIISI